MKNMFRIVLSKNRSKSKKLLNRALKSNLETDWSPVRRIQGTRRTSKFQNLKYGNISAITGEPIAYTKTHLQFPG